MRIKDLNKNIMGIKRITLVIIFISMSMLLFSQQPTLTITVVPEFGDATFKISSRVKSGEDLFYDYELSYRINNGFWSSWEKAQIFTNSFKAESENSDFYEFRMRGSDTSGNVITSNICGNSFARVWPVYNMYNTKVMDILCAYNQALGAGGHIYLHNGVDIGTQSNTLGYIVKAPVGGYIISITKDTAYGEQICIRVSDINGDKNIIFNHLCNISKYVSKDQSVKPNDTLGNIAQLPAYGDYLHTHLGYYNVSDRHPLDPYTIWKDSIYRDPYGAFPKVYDVHDRGKIRFKKGPHSLDPNDYLNSRNLIFGPIDIVVQAVDAQTNFNYQVPYSIGYSIDRLKDDKAINAVQQYTLISNDHWFGDESTSTAPSTMNALLDTRVDPVTTVGQYDTNWALWYTYIVTNATSTDGSATPFELDSSQCWRTDAAKGNDGENGTRNPTARSIEESQFPDGAYNINIHLSDLVHFSPPSKQKVIVDNFRPYVKDVLITETGGNILYKAKWDFIDGTFYYTKEADNPTNGKRDISIRVNLSEDMKWVKLSITNLLLSYFNFEHKDNYWYCTITADRLKEFKCNKVNAVLMIEGKDLADNPIEGFINTEPTNYIPKRTGENAGDWNPAPRQPFDNLHFFKIEPDPNDKDCKPTPPPPPPPPPFNIFVLRGRDPNDIKGPDGYGDPKWVSVNDVLPYTIQFENDPKLATGAVNKVVVTHPIDSKANMFSFRLGDITFRGFTLQVPPNTSYFFKRLNLADSIGVNIDITAGLDVTKKQAFWIFQALDPVTGLPNLNPELGFLPINDSITHHGEGSVSFSIKPKITDITGDTIKAFADIVFDVNDALQTNIAFNTIDALPPVSSLKTVTALSADNIKVSWTGHDDTGGCGIAAYTLLISENGGPYSSYTTGISDTTMILNLNSGNQYKIQTIAADYVGNTESFKSEADTAIDIIPASFFIAPSYNSKTCAGSRFTVQWQNVNNISTISLQVSADSGKSYTTIGEQIPVMDSVFVWNIPTSYTGNQYYKIRAVNSVNGLPLGTSDYFLVRNSIHVDAGTDKEICPESSIILGGSPTASNGIAPYTYQWSLSAGLNSDTTSNPNAFMAGDYVVRATDSLGCSNSDTLQITTHKLPAVYANGLDTAYNVNSAKVTLNGYPEGGIFSGKGITGNIFDPFAAQAGLHTITYTYTNEYGCTKHTKINTKVLPVILGFDTAYCFNAPADTLTGISAGGVFSGSGIVGNVFNPALAGEGIHEISYNYTDSTETTFAAIAKTIVYPLTLVSFSGLDSAYNVNADTVTLSGIPSGGKFSGSGIVDNLFIPTLAGIGTHQITYSYLDQKGCFNNQTQTVIINAIPTVSFSGLNAQYCLDADTVELTGTPAGGEFSGNGISDNHFIPSAAGVGTHQITYSYTDKNGWSNSQTQSVVINNLPSANLSNNNSSFCAGTTLTLHAEQGFKNYLWSTGATSQTIIVKTGGSYAVTVTDNNDCHGKDSIMVSVFSIPQVSLGKDTTIHTNDSILLIPRPGGFSKYLWNDYSIKDNLLVRGKNIGKGKHPFWVLVTDQNNCSNSDTVNVTVSSPDYINLYNADNTIITLYPNPTDGLLNLKIENIFSDDLTIELINMKGVMTLIKKYNSSAKIITDQLDLSHLAAGSYILKIMYGDIVKSRTIIKGSNRY